MDMKEILAKAQEMQAKAAEMQREVAAIEVEGQAGGGLLIVTLNGRGELKRIKIDPSLINADEAEILEDLVVAAHADAKRVLEVRLEQEMTRMSAMLGLPPGMM